MSEYKFIFKKLTKNIKPSIVVELSIVDEENLPEDAQYEGCSPTDAALYLIASTSNLFPIIIGVISESGELKLLSGSSVITALENRGFKIDSINHSIKVSYY